MLSGLVIFEKHSQFLLKVKDKFCLPLLKYCPAKITPDSLTYLRMVLGIDLYFLAYLEIKGLFWWLISFYILARFLDMFDGCLARLRGSVSAHGEFMDILADKFFHLVAFFVLIQLWPDFFVFPFIFLMMAAVLSAVLIGYFINKFQLTHQLCQLFEGVGYSVAIIIFIIQLVFR